MLVACALTPFLCGFNCEAIDEESDDEPEFADQDLQGTIGGKPWVYVQGNAPILYDDNPDYENRYHARFFPASFSPCQEGPPGTDWFEIKLDVSESSYTGSGTFVRRDENGGLMPLLLADTTVRIDEITTTTIRGALVANGGTNNIINGRFEISNCDGVTP